jgi:hypothetical protein
VEQALGQHFPSTAPTTAAESMSTIATYPRHILREPNADGSRIPRAYLLAHSGLRARDAVGSEHGHRRTGSATMPNWTEGELEYHHAAVLSSRSRETTVAIPPPRRPALRECTRRSPLTASEGEAFF